MRSVRESNTYVKKGGKLYIDGVTNPDDFVEEEEGEEEANIFGTRV